MWRALTAVNPFGRDGLDQALDAFVGAATARRARGVLRRHPELLGDTAIAELASVVARLAAAERPGMSPA